MNAPTRIEDKYELYRVVTDMDALHEGFRDRAEDLQITRLGLDAAGDLTPGYSSKLLCDPPMKTLGRESLPRMLKATGMVLVLVIDDERFAPIKEQLVKSKRPQRAIARRIPPRWLFRGEKARQMGEKRWSGISKAERSKIMKKVRRAAKAHRKAKQRKSVQVGCVAEVS